MKLQSTINFLHDFLCAICDSQPVTPDSLPNKEGIREKVAEK